MVCSASRPYSFCVDELGNIYKCNWFYGKDEHVIGNVATFKKYKELISQPEAKSFLSKRVTPREKCKNCVMLPICLGRCPLSWEVEEKYDCNRAINDLDKLIPEAYEWYQHFNES